MFIYDSFDIPAGCSYAQGGKQELQLADRPKHSAVYTRDRRGVTQEPCAGSCGS